MSIHWIRTNDRTVAKKNVSFVICASFRLGESSIWKIIIIENTSTSRDDHQFWVIVRFWSTSLILSWCLLFMLKNIISLCILRSLVEFSFCWFLCFQLLVCKSLSWRVSGTNVSHCISIVQTRFCMSCNFLFSSGCPFLIKWFWWIVCSI